MPDNNTTAARLQRQTDQIERAKEVIDRDPEESLKALESRTKATDGSPITVQDMFGLFSQLADAQARLSERMAAQQEQLVQVLLGQQKVLGRTERDSQAELEQAAKQQRMTLETWKTEPREPVWIQPEIAEEKIFAVMGEYPPRVFRVNGLEFPIAVGQVAEVPQSIAALVRHSQKQKPLQRPPQALPLIPDPARGQFLAGGQEISAGAAGKAGEGRLVRAPVAAGPDGAQPLDIRYDAYGR